MSPTTIGKRGYNIVTDSTDDFWVERMFNLRAVREGDRFKVVREPEVVNRVPDDWKFDDLAVSLGIFKSKSEARKNGWSGPFPQGYNERKAGKLGTLFMYVPVA